MQCRRNFVRNIRRKHAPPSCRSFNSSTSEHSKKTVPIVQEVNESFGGGQQRVQLAGSGHDLQHLIETSFSVADAGSGF